MKFTRKPPTLNPSEKEEININLDLPTLDLYCQYILSTNVRIRSTNLSTMKKLFDLINQKNYINDPEKYNRVIFIKRGLEARCERKLMTPLLILQYINGGPLDNNIIDTSNFKELSNEEVEWINESVSETLKFSFMYQYNDRVFDTYNKFKNADYSRKSEMVEEFENLINDIKTEFRRIQNESCTESEFSLEPEQFEETVTDIYSRETNSSRQLVCGLQGLNGMLGGGFEGGRVYLMLGAAAGGKSFTLLDLLLQIRKYNTNYVCHDKTKKPCIVLLTMENSVHETITRMYILITGEKMKNSTLDETLRRLREQGELIISEKNQINIIIKYKPNLSIDVGYLDTITEDLEDRGYEVMIMVQDHIKKIRAIYASRDTRLDLGEVMNEFKAYAVARDIPVLTCSHLNREAASIIDDAKRNNRQDIGKMMGRSYVSESMLMIDNSDVGFIITKEYDPTGNEWMDFLLIRTRCDFTIDYFAQPYKIDNPVKLVEDYNSPVPAYKITLVEDAIPVNKLRSGYNSKIKVLDDENYDEYGNPKAKPMSEDFDIVNYLKGGKDNSEEKSSSTHEIEKSYGNGFGIWDQDTHITDSLNNGQVYGLLPIDYNDIYTSYMINTNDYFRWHTIIDYLNIQKNIIPNVVSGIYLCDDSGKFIADGLGNIGENMIPFD